MERDDEKLRGKLERLEAELFEQTREGERYRSIIEHQFELICRYLCDGTLTFVNDAYCRFFNMTREELIGSDFKNLVPEQDRKQIEDMIAAMNGGMTFFAHEHRVFKPGGKIGWQLWTNRAVFGDRGNIVEYQGVGHDITARKEAEEALQQSVDDYEKQVEETSAELLARTRQMKAEIEERMRIEEELEIKSRNLEELNTALKVLLKHHEDDREELEERILSNLKELVLPYLEKLKKTPLKADQLAYMDIIESNLNDIFSPFLRKMTSKYLDLTPREIQIATLVREGRTTKEISGVLNISSRAVEFHRDNIRIKLGLKNKKANLRSFLLRLS
jgi:PAS domain S-box-containing protein